MSEKPDLDRYRFLVEKLLDLGLNNDEQEELAAYLKASASLRRDYRQCLEEEVALRTLPSQEAQVSAPSKVPWTMLMSSAALLLLAIGLTLVVLNENQEAQTPMVEAPEKIEGEPVTIEPALVEVEHVKRGPALVQGDGIYNRAWKFLLNGEDFLETLELDEGQILALVHLFENSESEILSSYGQAMMQRCDGDCPATALASGRAKEIRAQAYGVELNLLMADTILESSRFILKEEQWSRFQALRMKWKELADRVRKDGKLRSKKELKSILGEED